jgi:hypothetical protein
MCARRRFQVTADRKLLAGGEEILRYESPPKSGVSRPRTIRR